MKLPLELQNKIINFLNSLPNLYDTNGRKAFIYSVGLDSQLIGPLPFDEPIAQFVPLLVSILLDYGKLANGRYPLEAVLEATKNYIGLDKRIESDFLINGLYEHIQVFPQQIDASTYPVIDVDVANLILKNPLIFIRLNPGETQTIDALTRGEQNT